jgi:uncharacterized protein YegP (UPF0339 family)
MREVTHFILHKDTEGYWRWKFCAANHDDLCASSKGYKHKEDALHDIDLVKSGTPSAAVYDDSEKSWL